MSWVTMDEAKALADMPTDLSPSYAAWLIANPGKAGRLSAIVAGVVSEFRTAIASNPANRIDEDEAKVPESCVRSVEALVYGTLQNEMGVKMATDDLQAMTRADIFLRQISYKNFIVDGGGTESSEPSPAYTTDIKHPGRMLP